jgi:hypothetical protein
MGDQCLHGLLIGFRALQGLGAAALLTVSVAAISNAVARDHLCSLSRPWMPGEPTYRCSA